MLQINCGFVVSTVCAILPDQPGLYQAIYTGEGGRVVMQDGVMIDVARRKKEGFLKLIAQ
jgi:hypothetical protein